MDGADEHGSDCEIDEETEAKEVDGELADRAIVDMAHELQNVVNDPATIDLVRGVYEMLLDAMYEPVRFTMHNLSPNEALSNMARLKDCLWRYRIELGATCADQLARAAFVFISLAATMRTVSYASIHLRHHLRRIWQTHSSSFSKPEVGRSAFMNAVRDMHAPAQVSRSRHGRQRASSTATRCLRRQQPKSLAPPTTSYER